MAIVPEASPIDFSDLKPIAGNLRIPGEVRDVFKDYANFRRTTEQEVMRRGMKLIVWMMLNEMKGDESDTEIVVVKNGEEFDFELMGGE